MKDKQTNVEVVGGVNVLPHDIETEKVVLSTLMRYNDKFELYSDILSPNLFYGSTEKAIFKCIQGVISSGGITDINSLCEYALRNSITITENYEGLGDSTESNRYAFLEIFQLSNTDTLEQDIKRLRYLSKQRMSWLLLQQASKKVLDVTLNLDEEINGCIKALGEVQSEISDDGIANFGDALNELREIVNDNANGRKISLSTGFKLFDEYFLLRPGTLTVIAAFTSVGKTALAWQITINVAKRMIPDAYYSLEMGKAELASRAISHAADIPASIIMNKKLTEYQLKSFDMAVGNKQNLPIYIDERSTVSFDRTLRSIRTMVKTREIKLAVIDYLQIYSQVSDNTESSIAYMARAAKNIAKECGIAVIILSQLNRSGDHPTIKMLRGSGQIEESADNIVLIDRPEAYPDNKVTKYEGEFSNEDIHGTAKLILSKGRGVGTGCSLVGFDGLHTRFYELHDSEQEFPQADRVDMNVPF